MAQCSWLATVLFCPDPGTSPVGSPASRSPPLLGQRAGRQPTRVDVLKESWKFCIGKTHEEILFVIAEHDIELGTMLFNKLRFQYQGFNVRVGFNVGQRSATAIIF